MPGSFWVRARFFLLKRLVCFWLLFPRAQCAHLLLARGVMKWLWTKGSLLLMSPPGIGSCSQFQAQESVIRTSISPLSFSTSKIPINWDFCMVNFTNFDFFFLYLFIWFVVCFDTLDMRKCTYSTNMKWVFINFYLFWVLLGLMIIHELYWKMMFSSVMYIDISSYTCRTIFVRCKLRWRGFPTDLCSYFVLVMSFFFSFHFSFWLRCGNQIPCRCNHVHYYQISSFLSFFFCLLKFGVLLLTLESNRRRGQFSWIKKKVPHQLAMIWRHGPKGEGQQSLLSINPTGAYYSVNLGSFLSHWPKGNEKHREKKKQSFTLSCQTSVIMKEEQGITFYTSWL